MDKKGAGLLSEQQLLEAPEEDYMNSEQLAFFKHLLQQLHQSTGLRIQQAKTQMSAPINSSDPNDRATNEEQSSIALRIVEREQKLLPKIQQALERIRLGSYGYCLESEEPIGIRRLLARPTAEFCAEVKELKEKKEHHYRS
ncbi:TraR/DksA C4-type zinc finger protein [Agaribacterium haliotis]|uniref:TraR/DksA C4-type zinc finger protein n=1 Tax=Agaribacterium haliotis TaxID=2013869 RepID=UPI000BB5901D|nr:TraR/DksA C4-type zinc finger protein [Agaribacterium haliotis]